MIAFLKFLFLSLIAVLSGPIGIIVEVVILIINIMINN